MNYLFTGITTHCIYNVHYAAECVIGLSVATQVAEDTEKRRSVASAECEHIAGSKG